MATSNNHSDSQDKRCTRHSVDQSNHADIGMCRVYRSSRAAGCNRTYTWPCRSRAHANRLGKLFGQLMSNYNGQTGRPSADKT